MNTLNNEDLLDINAGGSLKARATLIAGGLTTMAGGVAGMALSKKSSEGKASGLAAVYVGGVAVAAGIWYYFYF